jgi:hypothetical protein
MGPRQAHRSCGELNESSVTEVSQLGPESRRWVCRADSAEDSTQERPRVLEVAQFLDKLKAGSVSSFGRGGEIANGMCSRDAGGDEFVSREEGAEVSVAHEGLGSKGDRVTVLVHVTEREAAVSRDRECTTHEGQREGGESVLEYESRGVTGIHNGAEDGKGDSEGRLGTDVVHNNDTEIIEVTDSSEVGRPDRVSHAPSVLGVGAQDDGELGTEGAAHRDA